MARVSLIWLKFCLLFFLIVNVFCIQKNQDELNIYKYNLNEPLLNDNYEIEIVRTVRDLTNAKAPNPLVTNRSDHVTPKSTPQKISSSTETSLSENNTITAVQNPSTNSINKTNSRNAFDVHEQQKLGENGAGQRIHYAENNNTGKPIHQLETIDKGSSTGTSTNTTEVNTTHQKNQTVTDVRDEISIAKIIEDEESLNKTLLEQNITKTQVDNNHLYYTSSFIVDPKICKKYWVDLDNRSDVRVNELLSQSHRRAATVKLSFDFPFYGHLVRNITIATGGFLYTGEYVHSWLAATQYIAPLMANFDTSLSNDSFVKYVDDGNSFTVQWEKVSLKDKPNDGQFTFQATLHRNGDILFVYKHVPIIIEQIKDDHHPVKVGLSDAYIIDRTIFFVRRKTIYEYHRVQFLREDIKNWTVIYLRALPTCLDMKNCTSCLTKISNFTCKWCPVLNRCSNGIDRHRQEWIYNKCDEQQASNVSECKALNMSDTTKTRKISIHDGDNNNGDTVTDLDTAAKASRVTHSSSNSQFHNSNDGDDGGHAGGGSMTLSSVIGVLFLIGLVAAIVGWGFYAYRNPHTSSGQFLIRYRPSQWSWRRGEARYTAATIHM